MFTYLGGFLLPTAPQSIARLLALGLGATACWTAIRHPHEYQTSVGLATVAAGFYVSRTTGDNGNTRPWWAQLPSQEKIDQAEKIVKAAVNRVDPQPQAPNPPNQPNQPNQPAAVVVQVPVKTEQ